MTLAFVPPEYPYERLGAARALAEAFPGGVVDLSIGTPCDPPSPDVLAAMARPEGVNGYPASRGSEAYREACRSWLARRFSMDTAGVAVAACIGTKELVASAPHLLHLRTPGKDTVLYPELSYPTYEMGAQLAGCRPVPVRVDDTWRLDVSAIRADDANRALLLWVNSPGNPAGQLDDLADIVQWGRRNGVLVASDECYAELTWEGPPRSVLEHGAEGILAVHSLSKRSNLAGLRAGFYAGEPDLVDYLSLVRMHAGMMVPGPAQEAGTVAWNDDSHAEHQRSVYRRRLERLVAILRSLGCEATMPDGGLYVWARCPADHPDSWEFAEHLARRAGALVSPGDLYGAAGKGYVRVAAVQPDERIELIAERISRTAMV